MGTDIHGRLQKRYHAGPYEDAGPIEGDRNYRVFAMLADVRNGYGVAGVPTHSPIIPISQPRGLPADVGDVDYIVTKEWRGDELANVEHWLGDHSYSWLTISEIDAWDGWDKMLSMTGLLSVKEFNRIQHEGGLPKEWCGGASGPGTVIVSAEEAMAGIEDKPHTYVRYDWQVPFREYTSTFRAWISYIKEKYSWMLEKDPAAVRIVFGFDS